MEFSIVIEFVTSNFGFIVATDVHRNHALATMLLEWAYHFKYSEVEPTSPMTATNETLLTAAARFSTVAIFILLLGTFLEIGRTLFLPIVSAAVVSLMLGPLAAYATERRMPAWVFATIVLFVFIGSLNIAVGLTSAPIVEWIGRGPDIASSVKDKLNFLDRFLDALRDLQSALSGQNSGNDLRIELGGFVQTLFSFLTPAIGELVVFSAALFFFLLGRNEIRSHLVLFFENRDARIAALRTLNEVERTLTDYMATVSVINIGIGLVTGVGAYLIGLPSPVTWGVLAFSLNYVPYIGPAIMILALFMVGLVVFSSLSHAIIAPILFLTLATAEGHFLTPSIVGKRLTLSPLLVFLALAFWTWLWGPIGAFLATPLLIVASSIIKHLLPADEIDLLS
jgi:predicted PurR-regulated permease PerM